MSSILDYDEMANEIIATKGYKTVFVAITNPNFDGLHYLVPEDTELGRIVLCPIRNRVEAGVVIEEETSVLDFQDKVRQVTGVTEYRWSESYIKFLKTCAEYYCVPLGAFIKMAMPNLALFSKIKSRVQIECCEYNFNLRTLAPKQLEIASKISGHRNKPTLLHGVTGSGKTEIYFKLIKELLEEDNTSQVLLLLPEIALSSNIFKRYREVFGRDALIWHSQVSPAKKRLYWRKIALLEERVVIGVRSAVSLPFANLKMIIVDEEHDQSYKQEEGVRYHARDMAVLRGMIEGSQVILGSATPSLESWYNVKTEKYNYYYLADRYNEVSLPSYHIVDMKDELFAATISTVLRKEMTETLAKGEQVMLFLNRKGYAPLYLCKSCKSRYSCQNCKSYLVYHLVKDILLCHHCGYQIMTPKVCSYCGESDCLISHGLGIEKLGEDVRELFPQYRTLIVSRADQESPKEIDEAIALIEDRQVDIIIGTQVIAKGYNFPSVNLVGILDVDDHMEGGNLRTKEQTLQLVRQVAGRAGRFSGTGEVYLQTMDITSSLIEAVIRDEDTIFYDKELAERKTLFMPPFARMASITISSHNEQDMLQLGRFMLAKLFSLKSHMQISDLIPAVLYRLKGEYRSKIYIRADKKYNLGKVLKNIVANVNNSKKNRITVDIDCFNFY